MCFLAMGVLVFANDANATASNNVEYSIKAPLAQQSLLLDSVSIEGKLVVVGERGHILISENHGKTWIQATVPTRATLTGVYFYNKQLGWVVGHDAVILRTMNGGKDWKRVYYAPEDETPLFDIWFENENNGFAVGAYGLVLTSADGGASWIRQLFHVQKNTLFNKDAIEDYPNEKEFMNHGGDFSPVYDFHLNHIESSDNDKLYIAAEAGNLYRSDDAGRTWWALSSPYRGTFFGVLPIAGDTLLAFGLRGNMYRSTDAGMSWRCIDTWTKETLQAGVRLQDGTVIIVGLGGTILSSLDNGETFFFHTMPDRSGLASITQSRKGTVVVVGESGIKELPRTYFSKRPN